jgi:hypothetical protein
MTTAARTRSLIGLLLLAVGVILAVAAIDMTGAAQTLAIVLGAGEATVGLGLVLQVALDPAQESEARCPSCGEHSA